jgi:ribosomal protein S18 acetylase RimI-like enzyme
VTGPFTVRAATGADVDAILSLETQTPGLSEIREREIVEAAVADDGCLVCIDRSASVIGFVVLSQRAFFGRDFLRLLEVSHRHRRLGVATALLAGAMDRCMTKTVFTSTKNRMPR